VRTVLTELCSVSAQVKLPKAAERCRTANDFAGVDLSGCESEKEKAGAMRLLESIPAACEKGDG
jgi:hypothetical protein